MTGPGVLYIIIWLYWSQIIVVTFSIRFYMNLDKNASEIMHAFVYNDEGTRILRRRNCKRFQAGVYKVLNREVRKAK